jgi:hypothetical protein
MEWVLTMGFLEQVLRNEQVRRATRNRVRGWVFWYALRGMHWGCGGVPLQILAPAD